MMRGVYMSNKLYHNLGLAIQILGPILAFTKVNNKVASEVASLILFSVGTLILVLSGFYRRSGSKEE